MNRSTLRFNTERRRGSTVVEMAFAVPLFFLFVFGIIEFSRMVMVKQALTDAARASSRKAALATTNVDTDAEKAARNFLKTVTAHSDDTSKCRVTISPSGLTGMASGTEITTTIEVSYSDVSWIVPSFLKSVVLRGQSTYRRE